MQSAAAQTERCVGEAQPGVRRLCVAAVTSSAGLLAAACELADADRPCLTLDAPDDTEMAFAPPGIHEVAVVTRLIAAMETLTSSRNGACGPSMLAFHVGITRIEGDGFGGPAPSRARALLRDPEIRVVAAGCGQLAVIMSDGSIQIFMAKACWPENGGPFQRPAPG
jgi:hypothetical protein